MSSDIGWLAESRLTFRITPGDDGYLRIQQIGENGLLRAPDPSPWATINALYLYH